MKDIEFSILDDIEWSKCDTSTITIEGWNSPLTIEYALLYPRLFVWRIQGTSHIFKINYDYIEKNHSKVEQHFELTLKAFRDDYLEWIKEDITEPFIEKYKNQYSNLIRL